MRKALAFVVVLGAFVAPALGADDPARVPKADRALLAQIMEETAVVQSPAQVSPLAYILDVVRAVAERLTRSLKAIVGGLPAEPYLRALAWVLLGLMAVVVALIVVRALLKPRKKRSDHVGAREEMILPVKAPTGAEYWRERARGLLREEDIENALVALWFYLAYSIGRGELDPSWTIRELLERRGRRELGGLGRRLERFMYGRVTPDVGDVRALLGEMEQAIP